jgi:hypothetical protein
MDVAVLLRPRGIEREFDMNFARQHSCHLGADSRHQLLKVEAGAGARLKFRVGWIEPFHITVRLHWSQSEHNRFDLLRFE